MLRGLTEADADGLVKEAFWGVLAKGLARGAGMIAKAVGRGGAKAVAKGAPTLSKIKPLAQGAGKIVPTAKGAPSVLTSMSTMQRTAGPQSKMLRGMLQGGKWSQRAGGMLQRGGQALSSAMSGMAQSPGKTLWRGGGNFMRGMMFSPEARGVGGALGKGTSVYSMGSMLLPSGQPQMPQPQYY